MNRFTLHLCTSLFVTVLGLWPLSAAEKSEWRIWTDNTGAYTTRAKLVAVRDGKVYLEKEDGQVVSLPIEKLSEGDQQYATQGTGEKQAGGRKPVPAPAPDLRSVVVTGVGVDPEAALKNALVTAVEQTMGVLIDAQTIVEHEEVIQEKIIAATNAFVERYTVAKTWQEGNVHHCRVRAEVRSRKLLEQLQANQVFSAKVQGKDLAARIETEELAKQGAAEVLRKCLLDLPNRVLTIRQAGKCVPISSTRLRIPVEISVDTKVYAQIMQDIEPELAAVARLKSTAASRYVPGTGFEQFWLKFQLHPEPFTPIDENPVEPKPGLLAAKRWFKAEGPCRPDIEQRELLASFVKQATQKGQRLAIVMLFRDLSSAGAAKITLFGFDPEAVQGWPGERGSKVVIGLKLLDSSREEVAAREITYAYAPGRKDGLILDVNPRLYPSGWPFVGVSPGGRIVDSGPYALFGQSWYGFVYVDLAADEIAKVETINLSVHWEPRTD